MEKSQAYKDGENWAYNDYMNCSWNIRIALPYGYVGSVSDMDEFWRGYNAMWNKMDNADRSYNPHDGDTTTDWAHHHS